MLRLVLKYLHPKWARKLGLQISDRQELRFLLRSIDRRIPDRSHYPERGKEAFLKQLPRCAKVLDVGCGNNSPYFTKAILPECYYVGLDVGEYNQEKPNLADEYIITSPEGFTGKITEFNGEFDAVISSHNLEHCSDQDGVLVAMLKALKPEGMLYLSCPSADSVSFPGRVGTLNYHDDASHQGSPPDFGKLVATITNHGCSIVFATSRYQPPLRWLIGLYHEASSSANRRVDTETWAFWGFESVIWARKRVE